MSKIIYDTIITGHHSEYINHVVDYLIHNPTNEHYCFVVHPDFPDKFKNIVDKTTGNSLISWHPITQQELDASTNLSMAKQSFAQYNLVYKYATSLNAKQVFLLYFNIFQLAFIFKKPFFTINGILFLQFFRMPKNTIKDKIKYYRKYYTTKFYAKNSKINSIFVLNDSKTSTYLNNSFNTSIFKMLPDPVPVLNPLDGFSVYEHFNINEKNKIFLHIGSLGERKGTFEVIKSAELIPKKQQSNITFLLVGKAESRTTEEQMLSNIDNISKNSTVQIIWENKFISNEMMKSLFNQSDVVLIPYKNPEASSGILGHAIAAKKPIITTGKGLLKEIVLKNNLGVLLDDVTSENIASEICKIQSITLNTSKYKQYIDDHTPKKFSETLLRTNNLITNIL